jgi:Nucleotidyl transferase AbiEii toxin, Type IV TA system
MLRKEAISSSLSDALHGLMELKTIGTHRLVGGTALALQIGHRISVDIDLFSDGKNDYEEIQQELFEKFGKRFEKSRDIKSNMGKGVAVFINNIKTDILDWSVRFIRPPFTIDTIRMAHQEDIIPMKFNAFLGPAEYARYEKKDYIDLACLMQTFSLEKMIALYQEKYPQESMTSRLLIEGLQLHELADKKAMPKMLTDQTWETTKKQIEISVDQFIASKRRSI